MEITKWKIASNLVKKLNYLGGYDSYDIRCVVSKEIWQRVEKELGLDFFGILEVNRWLLEVYYEEGYRQ